MLRHGRSLRPITEPRPDERRQPAKGNDVSKKGWLITAVIAIVAAVGVGAAMMLTSGGPATPTEALGAPRFVNEAQAAGVDHAYDGDWTYFVGGGVAAFDCNDDRKQDLYFAGGTNPAALYINESPAGGSLRFNEVARSGTELTEATGAYPIDIDSDGHTDLVVLRFGENVLFRGLGNCEFERANETLGFDGGDEWTAGFSATWEACTSNLMTRVGRTASAPTTSCSGPRARPTRIRRR